MFILNLKGKLWVLDKPVVMGILNITPDSFYDGGSIINPQVLLDTAGKMLEDGAAILDVGGQSTNPKSIMVSADEELERILPAIELLQTHYRESIISIDTFYSKVAQQAVNAGACIINDISAGLLDDAMLQTVAKLNVPYICMHMKGTPQTMQQLANYEDVVKEVVDYFIERVEACKQAGIKDIILDPGFGFAKTAAHNFTLLKNLQTLQILDKPILAGLSRKSTIYKTLNITAKQALNGTTVLNTVALLNGANILRVHDVKEAVEAITLLSALN